MDRGFHGHRPRFPETLTRVPGTFVHRQRLPRTQTEISWDFPGTSPQRLLHLQHNNYVSKLVCILVLDYEHFTVLTHLKPPVTNQVDLGVLVSIGCPWTNGWWLSTLVLESGILLSWSLTPLEKGRGRISSICIVT